MPRPSSGYTLKSGEKVPGCTTVIGRFGDKGGLLQWAFAQGQSGASSLYEKRDEAASIGTFGHALFEAHRKHQPQPKTPDGFTEEMRVKAENAYLAALEWEQQVKVESVAQEISLVCECYQYGCTLDEIVMLNGKLRTFEWKTANGIYVDNLLQAAAQVHAYECNNPGVKIAGAALVRFAKEYGDFAYHYFEDLGEPLDQFVRFVDAYRLDKKLKKRVG